MAYEVEEIPQMRRLKFHLTLWRHSIFRAFFITIKDSAPLTSSLINRKHMVWSACGLRDIFSNFRC